MFIAGGILLVILAGAFLWWRMGSPSFVAGMFGYIIKEITQAIIPSWKKIKDSKTPEEWEALRKKVAEDNRGDK